MAGIPITAAGLKIMWAVEETAGTMPTTGAHLLHDIKEIPDFNVEPEKLETTTFENLEAKTFKNGLKDLSNATGFKANFTLTLQKEWAEFVGAYETAKAANKKTWLFIVIPEWTEKGVCAYPCEPAKMGLPGVGVNAVWETTLSIAPLGDPKWYDDAPELATA